MNIPKNIEEKIKNVDLLTDFDGTMINQQSPYMEVLAYFFYKKNNQFKFIKDVFKEYQEYKKRDNIQGFYSLFKGCPVEILDEVVKRFHINESWSKIIEELKPQKIGIISRNNERLIQKYLDLLDYQNSELNLVAANIPKIKNDIYTGEVKIIIDNKDLADFVDKKDYICEEEEKIVVEKSKDIHSERLKNGLYLCYRKKIF